MFYVLWWYFKNRLEFNNPFSCGGEIKILIVKIEKLRQLNILGVRFAYFKIIFT
jgi:hypothetical protein